MALGLLAGTSSGVVYLHDSPDPLPMTAPMPLRAITRYMADMTVDDLLAGHRLSGPCRPPQRREPRTED